MFDVIMPSSILLYFCVAFLLRISPVRMVVIAAAGFAMCFHICGHCRTQVERDCRGRLNSHVLWPYREMMDYLLTVSKGTGSDAKIIAELQRVSAFDISRTWLSTIPQDRTSYIRFVESMGD